MDHTEGPDEGGERFLSLINAVAISAEDARTLVDSYRERRERQFSNESMGDRQYQIAKTIVKRYARLAAISGAATALPATVPGLGTALAMLGGGTIDMGVCMKLQVDMCRCLVECYGYDITSEDAKHLSMLLALCGTLEQLGGPAAVKLGTKAGVAMLRKYLRGAALKTIKIMLSTVGVRFTRKALEKSVPFGVGVIVGGSMNYGITCSIGKQAIAWLRIDGETA